MGHAYTITIQDVLIRYKRMDGYNTLWSAGHGPRGHRAPSTWWSGSSRRRGRPRRTSAARPSSARVWKWKEESGGTIVKPAQAARRLLRLGARALHDGSGPLARRCARSSCASTRKGSSTGATTSSTGARAARPCSPTSRWSARSATASSSTSSTGRSPSGTVRPETKLGDTGARRPPQGRALPEVRGQDARGAVGGGRPSHPGRRRRARWTRSSAPE